MSDFWDELEWQLENQSLALLGIAICSILVLLSLLGPKPASAEVITYEEAFCGKLKMVEYRCGWFGLGNPEVTVLSFWNGSEIVEFAFNKYLKPELDKDYVVTYEIHETIYYNMTEIKPNESPWLLFLSDHPYRNSTSLVPLNVLSADGSECP